MQYYNFNIELVNNINSIQDTLILKFHVDLNKQLNDHCHAY